MIKKNSLELCTIKRAEQSAIIIPNKLGSARPSDEYKTAHNSFTCSMSNELEKHFAVEPGKRKKISGGISIESICDESRINSIIGMSDKRPHLQPHRAMMR